MFYQMLDYLANRQTHDVGVGAADTPDQKRTQSLNGIGAGFVKWFAGMDIPFDFSIGQMFELHIGGNRSQPDMFPGNAAYADAGIDLMDLAA